MQEVTRFEKDMDGSMEPAEHGRWVLYTDYLAIELELIKLQEKWGMLTGERKEEELPCKP